MSSYSFYIKKKIDQESGFDYDKREVLSAPLWTDGVVDLNKIYINENQPHHQKLYYRNVYSSPTDTSSLDIEFSITYANYYNSGSSTGSFGLIDVFDSNGNGSGEINSLNVLESRAMYSMYRNLLSDYDTINNFASGSFKFRGIGSRNNGAYFWGTHGVSALNTTPLPQKITIPGVLSYKFNSIKSLSVRGDEYQPPAMYYINEEGKLFITFDGKNSDRIGNDSDWKTVSCGLNHILLLKQNGSMWTFGENRYGQLGLGFVSNGESQITQIIVPELFGNDYDWKFIKTGYNCSFAIRNNGELYSWGQNHIGQLGHGDNELKESPVRVGGALDYFKYVTTNVVDSISSITVFAIKDDDTLWGWGDTSDAKLSSAVPIGNPQTSPIQVTSMEWKKISVGLDFTIGISSNNELYSWGYNKAAGQLGLGTSVFDYYIYPTQIGTETDWFDIQCGTDYTLATKMDGTLYAWGDNTYNQQGRGFLAPGVTTPVYNSPTKIGNNSGWNNIAASKFLSGASINYTQDKKELYSSEDIYVINVSRRNFRDRIDSGTWELSFCGVSFDASNKLVADTSSIITLVDETIDYVGTADEYPTRDITNTGNVFYGIYSGSLKDGLHTSAASIPFGIFYPNRGLIVLNGEALLKSGSIATKRTPATSSGAIPYSSNADVLYTAISGAMSVGKPFTGRTVEIMNPSYYFIRIENEEYNHTFNPTYFSDPINFVVKDSLRTVPYPFTYITTIGLYNDDDDLLAVAKLSRPILKTPSTELVIKVKLDI